MQELELDEPLDIEDALEDEVATKDEEMLQLPLDEWQTRRIFQQFSPIQ